MDSAELHFINYDPEQFWNRIHSTYIDKGGDVLYPGNEKEILLRAVEAIGVAILSDVDNALRMDTRKYATGEYLEIYGDKRNCPIVEAKAAKASVEIVFKATGYAQTIPAGTELTADGAVLYHLTEDISQTGNEQSVETVIECSQTGTIGNGLVEGTQMQFIQNNAAILSVYTTSAATGGQGKEDEEMYRERIGVQGLTAVTTGPQDQYEAKAEAVSSLILDARAINDGAGIVGVYLILDGEADSTAMIRAVQEAITPKNVRPLNDLVQVHAAEQVAYKLRPTILYPSNANLQDAISKAIDEYKEWQDNTIGRAFNPDKLMAALYQLGATRVQYKADDGIGGAGATYTEIAKRSHCVGTITPELVVTA